MKFNQARVKSESNYDFLNVANSLDSVFFAPLVVLIIACGLPRLAASSPHKKVGSEICVNLILVANRNGESVANGLSV